MAYQKLNTWRKLRIVKLVRCEDIANQIIPTIVKQKNGSFLKNLAAHTVIVQNVFTL